MIELLRNRVKRLHLALQNLAFPINHYKHKTWSNGIYPEIKRLRINGEIGGFFDANNVRASRGDSLRD